MVWPFSRKTEEEELPSAPTLLPLTPEYRQEQHGIYFSAIQSALTGADHHKIKNIALTGSYGVGKSSILQKVASKHEKTAVTISLSTLGFADDEEPREGVAAVASSKTNRIQKEIVKQLLYGQDPVKMPGSRYRRITRFRFGREIVLGLLLAAPITLVFFLSGWSKQLAGLVRLPSGFEDLVNIGVWIAAAFFVVGIRKVLHNRIHIDKITAGDATIALSAESPTFFDEYLDEIVYFFEMTDADVVIFEDIDRFDDAHIFETLRSLNTLLNGAKQLGERNIRFIYAIKDSIFDELGARAAAEELPDDEETEQEDAAEAEVARANRTKFFDLVIPVVPFVTHRSARDLLKNTLSDIEHDVSDDLIDLAARHVADMRLLKNIRNEFAIFRQRIIVDGSLQLDDDQLLAMVLYKSTHMSDFELIKTGKSKLDALYADGRLLVNASIADRSALIRKTRQERNTIQAASLRSKGLGDALSEYIQRVVQYGETAVVTPELTMDGVAIPQVQLRKGDFWDQLAMGASPLTVSYRITTPWGAVAREMTLTLEDVAHALGETISPKDWAASRRAVLDKQIAEALADQVFLQRADMSDLAAHAKFTHYEKSFDQIVQTRLDSELARQLLRGGYIDRNYTLYTSTFYAERVSAEATNFILKNVDPNQMDVRFELTPDDVRSVLRERGRSVLDEKAAYNVSILDYLLDNDHVGLQPLLGHIAAYGEDEQTVLSAYFESGKKQEEFVRALMSSWPKIIEYLILEASLEEDRRIELLNAALSAISVDVEYEAPEGVGDFIENNYASLTTLTSDKTNTVAAGALAELLAISGATISDIEPLGVNVRASVIDSGLYAVTRSNLLLALDDKDADLALDAIRSESQAVYERVLLDLPAYLASLEDDEVTVAQTDQLATVIIDVVKSDSVQTDAIVERAVEGASVPDLSTVSSTVWETLAEGHRFPATFSNVTKYVDDIGMETRLGSLLAAAGKIQTGEDEEEADKLALALEILEAKDEIASGATRSNLVESIGLSEFIDADSIPIEEGELIGHLIGNNVIDDDAESFGRIPSGDWAGREYAIKQSTKYSTFSRPTELPAVDLGRFFSSELVTEAVKVSILDRIDEFIVGASASVLVQVADYAIATGHGLSLDTITTIAKSIGADRVLQLLEPHVSEATLPELTPVLSGLGGEFRKLIGPTGKRPKFDRMPGLQALVQRIDDLGYVGSTEDAGSQLRVNMRRP